jgi:hypothetical protein
MSYSESLLALDVRLRSFRVVVNRLSWLLQQSKTYLLETFRPAAAELPDLDENIRSGTTERLCCEGEMTESRTSVAPSKPWLRNIPVYHD